MTAKQLELVNPRCLNCSETAEAKQKRKFQSVVKGVLVDIGMDERNGF